MISEFVKFDTKHFIQKTLERQNSLPELKQRYAELDGIASVDFEKDRVDQSPSNNQMVNIVADRIRLKEKIKNYELDCQKLETALKTLSKTEKRVFQIYFVECGNLDDMLSDIGLSIQTGYRIRKTILTKIEKVICG